MGKAGDAVVTAAGSPQGHGPLFIIGVSESPQRLG